MVHRTLEVFDEQHDLRTGKHSRRRITGSKAGTTQTRAAASREIESHDRGRHRGRTVRRRNREVAPRIVSHPNRNSRHVWLHIALVVADHRRIRLAVGDRFIAPEGGSGSRYEYPQGALMTIEFAVTLLQGRTPSSLMRVVTRSGVLSHCASRSTTVAASKGPRGRPHPPDAHQIVAALMQVQVPELIGVVHRVVRPVGSGDDLVSDFLGAVVARIRRKARLGKRDDVTPAPSPLTNTEARSISSQRGLSSLASITRSTAVLPVTLNGDDDIGLVITERGDDDGGRSRRSGVV